ncbi:ubiquitin-like modifier 1 [Annulohypoxylon nitens]|nr:ubiquitin-like modifier 1 [Annulohypoxylon nitens]
MSITTQTTSAQGQEIQELQDQGQGQAQIQVQVPKLSIVVEFTGGLEMLFSDQRRHSLSIPASTKEGKPVTIADLIDYLCENTMKDSRKELFVLEDHLRPGILVLINDADWELEGEEAYEIQAGDNILFVSTLHGG